MKMMISILDLAGMEMLLRFSGSPFSGGLEGGF